MYSMMCKSLPSAFAGPLLVLFVLDGLGPEMDAGPVQLQLYVRRNIAAARTDILPYILSRVAPDTDLA